MRTHLLCPPPPCPPSDVPDALARTAEVLAPDPLTALLLARRKICYDSKRTIFHEGDSVDSVFLIASGTVCLYRFLPNGRRMIKEFLFAGDTVGLSFEGEYPFTAECITAASAYKISLVEFRQLCEVSAALQSGVIAALKRELSREREDQLPMLHQAAEARVARLLGILARRRGERLRKGEPVQLSMTRGDIADHLGLTIETVCRTFTKLKGEGLISALSPDHILIQDVDRLSSLAEGQN